MKVLVSYASVHGSTRDIADRIAQRLAARGLAVDCQSVADAGDICDYDAVVLGSALHGQAWLPEAERLLARNFRGLRERHVWLFSVGIPGALPAPLRRGAMHEGPKALANFVALVRPRGTILFSGVIAPEHVALFSRAMMRAMGTRFGDFRDWAAIDSWADGIGATLSRRESSTLAPTRGGRSRKAPTTS